MHKEHLKFVVVGSVDHGKSTLIGRFLYDTGSLPEAQLQAMRELAADTDEKVEFAFVLDHLEEERTRRITIDTAQRFFSTDTRDYVIIDAPGHKEFLKNMITGASQASAALLLLDVDEGIQQQTRRHAFMLSLLGIKQLVGVLNKMDLVDFSQDVFNEKSRQFTELLEKVELDRLAIVPASALLGDNIVNRSERMDWYDGPTVTGTLDLFTPSIVDEALPFRLPVQDVYDVDGRKIAVGRVAAGTFQTGQTVWLSAGEGRVQVATIEEFGKVRDSASAGESIGVTMADGVELNRGDVLSAANDTPAGADSVVASVFWMNPVPLERGETISLRLATQEVPCTVEKIANRLDSGTIEVLAEDADHLEDTEVAEVTLAAERPVYFDRFAKIAEMGRLVLMRGTDIVGGGILP